MNRKIIAAATAATILALTGCSNVGDSINTVTSTSETSATSTESTTVAISDNSTETADTTIVDVTTTVEFSEEEAPEDFFDDDPAYTANEELLNTFLTALKNGTAASEISATYDLDNITLDSYSYVAAPSTDTKLTGSAFDVTLNISASSNDVFPVGQSDWRIVINPDMAGYVTMFCPIQKRTAIEESIILNQSKPSYDVAYAYKMAVEFSMATGLYSADENWDDGFLEKAAIIHQLYHAFQYQGDSEVDTAQSVADKLKLYFDLDVTADDVSANLTKAANDEGNYLWQSCGHGSKFLFTTIDSSKEATNGLGVEVTFYADTAYLCPAVTASYSFSRNDDGSLHLESVETINDYGLAAAIASV